MTALDSRPHYGGQPLFLAALAGRAADAAARLERAQRRGDALLAQICAAELDDLRSVAARHDLDVPGL